MPNVQAHLSAFSNPRRSYQAFKSSSVVVSSVSCASVFTSVSAAGSPFGPDPAIAEQPAGSLQSYGITAYYKSPNELPKWPWQAEYCVLKPPPTLIPAPLN